MRGFLAAFLIQAILTAATNRRTNQRNNNTAIWLMVIGLGIVALAFARKFNARGIWQSIKNFRNPQFQAVTNLLNTENPEQTPSFMDGKSIPDIASLIDDSTFQKELQ